MKKRNFILNLEFRKRRWTAIFDSLNLAVAMISVSLVFVGGDNNISRILKKIY